MNTEFNKIGLFIGQAPPEKEYKIPFSRTRLYKWFGEVNIDKDSIINSFDFEALSSTFPGRTSNGHKTPSKLDIALHIPHLIKKIELGNYKLIIPIGKLAIQYVLNSSPKFDLRDVIGNVIYRHPFGLSHIDIDIVPLPHPSGINTWEFNDSNRQLLRQAIANIKERIV